MKVGEKCVGKSNIFYNPKLLSNKQVRKNRQSELLIRMLRFLDNHLYQTGKNIRLNSKVSSN